MTHLPIIEPRPNYYVTLIGEIACPDQAVGLSPVAFWHVTQNMDSTEAVTLWGVPVGSAFGSWMELWLVDQTSARRIYPFPDLNNN